MDQDLSENPFHIIYGKMKDDLRTFFWDAFTALGVNAISGDYVELGSAGATTMRIAHDVISLLPAERHMWAYDSFEGLPPATDRLDEHPAFAPGVAGDGLAGFVATLDEHGIPREDYTAVPGYFEHTLGPEAPGPLPTDIALAYVDCNMYSSTVTVLEFLAPRLKHGMVLAFDDYFCWTADDVSGERVAVDEFLAEHPQWNLLRFKDPTWGGASFVVEAVDADRPRRRP